MKPRGRGPFRRGIAEFLRLPFWMTAAFVGAAVAVSVLDRTADTQGLPRMIATAIVPTGAASGVIQAVAGSLLTVTSITFSVLLVAVQQTSSSLTAVVFDQFLRRTANQVYFGFFVGVTAFAFVALGLARTKQAPVYAAVLTLLLTLAALVVLLLLVHATIDQMRPQTVVRSIQALALEARQRELELIGRTRPAPARPDDPAHEVDSPASGYVVGIDVDALARVAEAVGDDGEVRVRAGLGDYVVFGDALAEVAGVGEDDDAHDEAVLRAFRLDDVRNVRIEADYAIDQLENIAWSTGSSALQSPHVAAIAIRALRDVGGRWLLAGERDRSERAESEPEVPVVYIDGAVDRLLAAMAALVVGSAESRQPQTCAELLRAFAEFAPRLRSDEDREVFVDALHAALPAVLQHARTPALGTAIGKLEDELRAAHLPTDRLAEVDRLMITAQERLLPKASEDPEAAHPASGDS